MSKEPSKFHDLSLYNSGLKEKETKILDFLFFWGRPIKAGVLVKQLKFKHSTLNSVLKRLMKANYVKWEKYGVCELTEEGKKKAMHLTNHHFIIEKYLKDTLEISDKLAHKEALNLSRLMSCELIEKICEKYNYCHKTMNYDFCEPRDYELH